MLDTPYLPLLQAIAVCLLSGDFYFRNPTVQINHMLGKVISRPPGMNKAMAALSKLVTF